MDAEDSAEVRRDAYGAPLPVVIDSDSDDEENLCIVDAENESTGHANVLAIGTQGPIDTDASRETSPIGIKETRATVSKKKRIGRGDTAFSQWSGKVKEKACPGYGVRRDLKKWSDRVLQGINTDENAFDLDLIDADQIDLGDEGANMKSQATGLGAELRAYWMHTVEDEVEARLAAIHAKWEEDMAFEIEELKELREQNRILQKEVSDQRSQMDALTLRLHVMKSKHNKSDTEKKEDTTKKSKGKTVNPSSVVAREMLMDSEGKSQLDSDHEKQMIIDKLKKKITSLEKSIQDLSNDAASGERRTEQLEQQIQYMNLQHEQEVRELQKQLSDADALNDHKIQELQEEVKKAKKQATEKKSSSPESSPTKARRSQSSASPARPGTGGAAEWKKEKENFKKEISRLRMKIEELKDELLTDPTRQSPREQNDGDLCGVDQDNEDQDIHSQNQQPPLEGLVIDPVPFRLEGVQTVVDIVRKSVEQVKEPHSAETSDSRSRASHAALSVGNYAMGAISTYVHEIMQSTSGTLEFPGLTKEQDSVRMMAGMELLTKVSSIQRDYTECMMKSAEEDFRAESVAQDMDVQTWQVSPPEVVPHKEHFSQEKPPRPANKTATVPPKDPPVEDSCKGDTSDRNVQEVPGEGTDHSVTIQERIRMPLMARLKHDGLRKDEDNEGAIALEDVFLNEANPESKPKLLPNTRLGMGWLDLDESEIGDFPYDDLTGCRASSPEELSDSGQPAFISVRSYQQKLRRMAEFPRLNTDFLSRPLSAPARGVVHMEKASDKWARHSIRRIKRSRVIVSTPQKGICLEHTCSRRKRARRKKTRKHERFRIQTVVHPMRGHMTAMKGYLLQHVTSSMRKEMVARVQMRTYELTEVLKQVQTSYEKACSELEISRSQQHDLAEAVAEARELWLCAQDDKLKLQEEVQELRRRLHEISVKDHL